MSRPRATARATPLAAGGVLVAALIIAAGAASATLPSGHGVNQKEACLDCHDLSGEIDARVLHAPVRQGECSACHNPHVARFSALLKEEPGPLCESCHPEVARSRQLPSVHRPVADGRCADCHEPHGGANRGLLVERGVALCAGCHPAVSGWQAREVQHRPFAQSRCESCHEPHASAAEGLMTAAGADVCSSCHAIDDAFRSAHAGYPVERSQCGTCHDPHASGRRGLFRETLHAPFASGDCENCHLGAESPQAFALTVSQDQLCGDCHAEQVEASRQAPFPHVSGGGGRCTSCHNPHAGEGPGMLVKEPSATCLTCHDPGGAKSGAEGRFSSHAEGVECTVCHAPHGGERPLLLAESNVELCGSCHAHEHGVAHPLGEETRDPRTGTPMDCSSCHGIHEAPYEMYLHASGEGELCLGCHRDLAR